MSIEYAREVVKEILNSLYGDSKINSLVLKKLELSKMFYEKNRLVDEVKKLVGRCVVEKIKEEKSFELISYKAFISDFVDVLSVAQIESVVNEVFYMTSEELIEICNIIKNKGLSENKDYNKNIKRIVEIVLKRGGGNKKYWREVMDKVKGFEIDEINKMVEKKIDKALEC